MRSLLKPAAALAAALTVGVTAGCSGDVTAPTAITAPVALGVPTTTPNAALGSVGSTSAITSRQAASMCLDVLGGPLVSGAAVGIWGCHDGANQQFTWSSAGELRSGSLCVDAAGGSGSNGDGLLLWSCHGGANQKWTATSAGELRGINGRCVDIPGGNAVPGAQLIIWDCHGGSNQIWDARTSSAAPAPTPAPAPAPPSGGSAVLGLMGQTPSVATVEALGGEFARYEQEFRKYADQHWANEGASVGANYYDRAMIYYVWWARTGNTTYLTRANALAVNYRRNFLEARGFEVLPYETFVDGVALHYLVTGDQASRTAVGRVADRFATSRFIDVLGNPAGEVDNRDQARVLTALLVARQIGAPTATGTDWAARARTAMTNILASQHGDGAYRFTNSQCGQNKPWMVGLLNDVLVRYHEGFEADSRILPAVKRSLDYIWANDWRADQQAIVYIGGNCNGETPYVAGDLNNLVSSGFGWVYRRTGDGTYRSRGDQMFTGGVANAWLPASKQFNQEYTSSYRYLSFR